MNWRTAQAAVRELLWQWDPIDVAGLAPDDEYDCLIGPIIGLLSRGADQQAVANLLRHESRSHFDLDPVEDKINAAAERLVRWFEGVRPAAGDGDAKNKPEVG
jgi:hypothetical protein